MTEYDKIPERRRKDRKQALSPDACRSRFGSYPDPLVLVTTPLRTASTADAASVTDNPRASASRSHLTEEEVEQQMVDGGPQGVPGHPESLLHGGHRRCASWDGC
ncbi:hypothetical protein AB0M29_38920 [Streptomyces sp. NPDC051976]|uniref:hypothetical protein n=1 Tax=Streptomyces sp. NPDC051976 TaxID=3154947 RepID=UPI00343D2266